MRWWGWGQRGHPPALPAHALGFLRENVGLADVPRAPVALSNVRLDAPSVSDAVLAELARVVGAGAVSVEHLDRVEHAAGKGYPDLVRLRQGRPTGRPTRSCGRPSTPR